MTRAGGLYICLTLLLGFAAVNTGNNLLYLLVSALLGFMVATGLLGQQNLQRLGVRLSAKQEIYAGSAAMLSLEVHNRRCLLPGFLLRAEVDGEAVLFPVLPAGERDTRLIPFSFSARGFQPLPVVRLVSRFPVNFFTRFVTPASSGQVLVFPAPLSTEISPAGADRQGPSSSRVRGPGMDGELRNIDEYRPGDAPRTIHWKLSARHDDLKVKRHSRQQFPSISVEPATLPGTFEEQLRRATYLINRFSRRQQPVGLRLGKRSIAPATGSAHRLRLLKELSLYER